MFYFAMECRTTARCSVLGSGTKFFDIESRQSPVWMKDVIPGCSSGSAGNETPMGGTTGARLFIGFV